MAEFVLTALPVAPSVALIRNEEPQECEEASIDAMTDGHIPSDEHEKRGLDPTGDACVDLPVGAVDLLDASPVECRSNGDHGEASLGRHLGREHEVSADQSPQTSTSTTAGNSAAAIDHHLGGQRFHPPDFCIVSQTSMALCRRDHFLSDLSIDRIFCSRVTIARFNLPDKANQQANPVMANAATTQIKSPAPPMSLSRLHASKSGSGLHEGSTSLKP